MLRLLLIVVSVAYPLIVYFALKIYQAGFLLPLLFGLFILRCCISTDKKEGITLLLLAIALGIAATTTSASTVVKLYPVFVNMSLLGVFFVSLFQSQSFVERLARLREPNLTPAGVSYTRKVTWLWSGFLLCNGIIAFITSLWASDETWALYNGGIAYVLIGILMAGEWLVRRRVKRLHALRAD